MRHSARRFVNLSTVAALLTACTGPQSPVSAPGEAPRALSVRAQPSGKSWADVALLYVSAGPHNVVYQRIMTSPKGRLPKLVKITELNDPSGECTNEEHTALWITTGGGEVYEFEHGGTTPIGSLSGGDLGCSYYRTTGSLAAVDGEMLSVWQNASGTPTTYSLPGVTLQYCGYDNQGNLFVDGYSNGSYGSLVFAELPNGGTSLEQIIVNVSIGRPGQVQWDGDYITIQDLKRPFAIYGLSVSGSAARVVRTFQPRFPTGEPKYVAASWIYTFDGPRDVFIPYGSGDKAAAKVSEWIYPGNDHSFRNIDFASSGDFQAVTFSD